MCAVLSFHNAVGARSFIGVLDTRIYRPKQLPSRTVVGSTSTQNELHHADRGVAHVFALYSIYYLGPYELCYPPRASTKRRLLLYECSTMQSPLLSYLSLTPFREPKPKTPSCTNSKQFNPKWVSSCTGMIKSGYRIKVFGYTLLGIGVESFCQL